MSDLTERLLDTSRYATESEREATLRRNAVRAEAAKHIEDQTARIKALEAELDRAREALKPFALAMATLSSRWLDYETSWQEALPRPITVRELRQARQALSPGEE